MQKTRDNSLGRGVFYAREDCRGILSRILILFVDFIVLILAWSALAAVYINRNADLDDRYFFWCLLIMWLYLAVLRSSPIRTVGYWLASSQIVTLRGGRPSVFRMTLRLALWIAGPFNLIYDLAWSGVEIDRQSLRDRFTGTVLIRRGAKPIGTGEIHLERFFLCGFAVIYARVMNRKLYETSSLQKQIVLTQ